LEAKNLELEKDITRKQQDEEKMRLDNENAIKEIEKENKKKY
jgi:hypothetical protein